MRQPPNCIAPRQNFQNLSRDPSTCSPDKQLFIHFTRPCSLSNHSFIQQRHTSQLISL